MLHHLEQNMDANAKTDASIHVRLHDDNEHLLRGQCPQYTGSNSCIYYVWRQANL